MLASSEIKEYGPSVPIHRDWFWHINHQRRSWV